jgi:hypothetical protein
MVYEPGGYNFMDYIKFGLPLQIVCFVFTVAIVFSLDSWWIYALVMAILCPIVVIVYFFIGSDKASIRENPLGASDEKATALEEGHAANGGDSPDKAAASESPSPVVSNNIALLPVAAAGGGSDHPAPIQPIAQGNGSEPSYPDHSSTSSALIFTGTA